MLDPNYKTFRNNYYTKVITNRADFNPTILNQEYAKNGNRLTIEIPNTKGVTKEILLKLNPGIKIRVAGGYDDERLKAYEMNNGMDYIRANDWYNGVIYTRNETIKIVEQLEKIEKGLNPNWDEKYKFFYLYDKLKSTIDYDPEYETRTSLEVRSLRGLVSKKTVCAGYALILKEICDRQGIKCRRVGGNGHAWNIIQIDDKMYPIDLTWDSNIFFCNGEFNSMRYLGNDIDGFNKRHIPDTREPFRNYQNQLSTFDPKEIKEFFDYIHRDNTYQSTTWTFPNSNMKLAQIGKANIRGTDYFRYYYSKKLPNGKVEGPLVLYSELNLQEQRDNYYSGKAHAEYEVKRLEVEIKEINKAIGRNNSPKLQNLLISKAEEKRELEEKLRKNKAIWEKKTTNIQEKIFSSENINDSVDKDNIDDRTFYIGSKINAQGKIEKDEKTKKLFSYYTRLFRRANGQNFVVQQNGSIIIDGIKVNGYDVIEEVMENGQSVVKRNLIYTEIDLKNALNSTYSSKIKDLFSREEIEKASKNAGGYLGYIDNSGHRQYNHKIAKILESPTSKEKLAILNNQTALYDNNFTQGSGRGTRR